MKKLIKKFYALFALGLGLFGILFVFDMGTITSYAKNESISLTISNGNYNLYEEYIDIETASGKIYVNDYLKIGAKNGAEITKVVIEEDPSTYAMNDRLRCTPTGTIVQNGHEYTISNLKTDSVQCNLSTLSTGMTKLTKITVYYTVPGSDPEPTPTPENTDYLETLRNELKNAIDNAVSGETIVWTAGDSLPYDIMQQIKNSDVTVEFIFTYEGVEYVIFINKYNVPTEEEEWYGPCYLMGLDQSINGANDKYAVVEGDTLDALATKYNTTVDAILRANPSITNPNLIYIGQQIVIPVGKQ